MKKGLLDFTWMGKTCENRNEIVIVDSLPLYLQNRTIKTLGYPRIEDYDNKYRYDQEAFMWKVREEVIDMDDPQIPEEVKSNIEFTVDLTTPNNHTLNFQVKRNETRVDELKQKRTDFLSKIKDDETVDLIDTDVFIFYVDGLSRTNLKRQLPKFFEWLGQFVDSEDETIDAYQFFRFQTVKENTYKANHAMWYGIEGYIKNDSENLFQNFSNNGYITGFARDGCEQDSVMMAANGTVQDFPVYRWDHQAVSFT